MIKQSILIKFFLLAFVFSVSFNLALRAQELGRYIEQFEGQEAGFTVTVSLLRIGDKSEEEVLIKISGVDDPMNDQIYKYKKEWQTSERRFNRYKYVTTEVPGVERLSPFHSDYYYGSQIFKLYLMDEPMNAISIYPSKYATDLTPASLYEQYLQQAGKRLKAKRLNDSR